MAKTTLENMLRPPFRIVAVCLCLLSLPAELPLQAAQETTPPAAEKTDSSPQTPPPADNSSVPPAETDAAPAAETPPETSAESNSQNDRDDSAAQQPAPMDRARDLTNDAIQKVDELAVKIDQDPKAQQAAAGLLQPIYILAESLSFAAFYWLAFTLMTAGVVSHAFQLFPGKLVVLFKGSLNIREILSDATGLVISALGLILTTQAATENSTFTQSPASVLSAAAAGAVLGLALYRWGQRLEIRAVVGQKLEARKEKKNR